MAKYGPNWEGGCDSALEGEGSGNEDTIGKKAPVHDRSLTYPGTADGAGGGVEGDSFGSINKTGNKINQP